jgi:Tfp pilus assembly protein PilE
VELLVVVAILAILSVALLPSVLGYSDKARDARAIKDVRNFTTVVEAFAAQMELSRSKFRYRQSKIHRISHAIQRHQMDWRRNRRN